MSTDNTDMTAYIRDVLQLDVGLLRARLIAAERSISQEEALSLLAQVSEMTMSDEPVLSKNKVSPGSPQVINKKQKTKDASDTSVRVTVSDDATAVAVNTTSIPSTATDSETTSTTPVPTAYLPSAITQALPPSRSPTTDKIPANTKKDKKQRPEPKPEHTRDIQRREKAQKGKTMDWSHVHRRRIALQFCYLGEKYAGLAIQEGYDTVEAQLFAALTKTCLIPDMSQCNYTRCGRTDKGVNARMQVVALDVRTNYPFTKALKQRTDAAAAAAAAASAAAVPGVDGAVVVDGNTSDGSAPPPVPAARVRGYVPPYTTTEEYIRGVAALRGVSVPEGPLTPQDVTRFYVEQFQPLRRHVGGRATRMAFANAEDGSSAVDDGDVNCGGGNDSGSEVSMDDATLPSNASTLHGDYPYTASSVASLSVESLRSSPLPSGLSGPREAVAWSSPYDHTTPRTCTSARTPSHGVYGNDVNHAAPTANTNPSSSSDTNQASTSSNPTAAGTSASTPASAQYEYDEWVDDFELDYVTLLNNVLPDDIRVTAWAPVDLDFSARFSCDVRVYKYLFYADNMDIGKMNQAAKLLKGTYDFRNLCKMDVVHLTHFVRRVCDACVQVCPNTDYTEYYANAELKTSSSLVSEDERPKDASQTPKTRLNALKYCYSRPPVSGSIIPSNISQLSTSYDDKTVIEAAINNSLVSGGAPTTTITPTNLANHGPILLSSPGHSVSALPTHRDVMCSSPDEGSNTTTSTTTFTSIPASLASSTTSSASAIVSSSSSHSPSLPPDTLCEFVVVGEAFLYHQVRCMMAVLFLVGQGLEPPEIITELLDLEKTPSKPTYEMAAEQPLILWDGIFADVKWRTSTLGLQKAFGPLYRSWREWRMKAHVLETFWRTLLPTAVQCALDAEVEWQDKLEVAPIDDAASVEDGYASMASMGSTTQDKAARKAAAARLPSWHRQHPVTTSISAAHRPRLHAMLPVHASFGTTIAKTVPFLQLAPAITSKNTPSLHPQPLSLVAATFPPLLGNHMHNILRARGLMGFQTKVGKIAKITPLSTEEDVWGRVDDGATSTALFPYAECYGHVPLPQRPRENTLEEKVGGLSGKKRDLKEKSTEFMVWLKEKYTKEEM